MKKPSFGTKMDINFWDLHTRRGCRFRPQNETNFFKKRRGCR